MLPQRNSLRFAKLSISALVLLSAVTACKKDDDAGDNGSEVTKPVDPREVEFERKQADKPDQPPTAQPVEPMGDNGMDDAVPPKPDAQDPGRSDAKIGTITDGGRLVLDGITLKVPDGWEKQDSGNGSPFGGATPKVRFVFPADGDEAKQGSVEITHFPNMKGMDDANLQRWYGQFEQPDGSATADVVKREDVELDGVELTIVDMSGTMKANQMGMGNGGGDQEGYRMIAAIVNHPKGPHFVKVTGPEETIEQASDATMAFLKSAKLAK